MAGDGLFSSFQIHCGSTKGVLRRVGEFPGKLSVCCVEGNNLTAQLIFTETWQQFFSFSLTSTVTERANDVTWPPAEHSSKYSHQRYPLQNRLQHYQSKWEQARSLGKLQ